MPREKKNFTKRDLPVSRLNLRRVPMLILFVTDGVLVVIRGVPVFLLIEVKEVFFPIFIVLGEFRTLQVAG